METADPPPSAGIFYASASVVITLRDADATAKVKATVNRLHAPTAQHYGWLVIEELTDRTSAEVQVVSPPATALP